MVAYNWSSPASVNCPLGWMSQLLFQALSKVISAFHTCGFKVCITGTIGQDIVLEVKWKLRFKRGSVQGGVGWCCCVVRLVAGSKSVDVYIWAEISNALGTSESSPIAPDSSQSSTSLSSVFPFFLLYTSHYLFSSFWPWIIQLCLSFQMMSALSHSSITRFWHLSFGCDFTFADLWLVCWLLEMESLPRPAGTVGSGRSKIANNSPLKTVLFGKGAKFLLLGRWNSEAFFPFLIVLFFTGLETLFSSTPPNGHSPFLP